MQKEGLERESTPPRQYLVQMVSGLGSTLTVGSAISACPIL